MDCYTIDGPQLKKGIVVTTVGGVLDARSGDEGPLTSRVPAGVRIGEPGRASHVLVAEPQAELAQVLLELYGINALTWLKADVVEEPESGPVLVNEEHESPWLLVHVAIPAGSGGRLWFEDILLEKIFSGREVRMRPAAFPGPGVKVLAIGCGELGEPQALLKLARGASFRIHRTGELDGELPVIEVRYRKELEVGPPKPKK
jgi:hypothetical protein